MRTRGRAARVVERIVGATVAELSRVGYEAMRVEDVAARSGVNKTTIYRRWPTKAEMVASALVEGTKLRPAIDTGSLREDLRISLLGAFKLKPSEQGVLRIMQMERSIADVDALARRMRDELRNARIAIVRRGIARGELPSGVDVELIVELVSAPVQRALLFNETIDEQFIERTLDVVLTGAAAHATGARTGVRRKRADDRITRRSEEATVPNRSATTALSQSSKRRARGGAG